MPQKPHQGKLLPQSHLARVAIVVLLMLAVEVLDEFYMDVFPWIDFAWAIPIAAAAILLSPFETALVGLVSMVGSLVTQVTEESDLNFWTSGAIGVLGLVVALKAYLLRRYFSRINVIRDALEESPLAYAEFSFPGYMLMNFNRAFSEFSIIGAGSGTSLADLFPHDAAEEISKQMDLAVSTRERVDNDALSIPDSEGVYSYWRVNFIPQASQGSTPRSVALFAIDVSEEVNRGRTREAALRISAAVMSSLSLDETVRVVLDNLAVISGTDSGALFILEDEQWVGMAGYGEYSDESIRGLRYPYDEVAIGVAAVEGRETIAAENAMSDPRFSPERLKRFKVKSSMVVPMVSSSRPIGVVLLNQTVEKSRFTEEQIKFATVIGSHAALAIENAGIYENEHYIRKSLEAIEAISEAGLASIDLEEVLIELVTRTQDVMQMDAAMIMLVDESGERLVARAAAGCISVPLDEISTRVGEGLAGRAFQEGVPMKIDNYQNESDAIEIRPFVESSGVKSILAVPLRIGGRVAGVLQIGSQREKAFSAREWGLIQVLADRASMAVQNSLLYDATRKELARVALLRDVAAACAGSHDIRKIAKRAVEAVYEQMGCMMASIYFLDAKKQVLVNLAFHGHTPEIMAELTETPLERGTLLTRAVVERRMITHEEIDLANASESEAYILKALDIGGKRRCTVPFIYKDEVVGGMALVFPDKRPFTPAAIETILSIANQMAVAIHSSELPSGDRRKPESTKDGQPASTGMDKHRDKSE
ncbi:MAG: GAF domain-containing protein [Thermoleophilia bacterium]|nr:GAF domain-containing protein [Thermoleophilia bacterium]